MKILNFTPLPPLKNNDGLKPKHTEENHTKADFEALLKSAENKLSTSASGPRSTISQENYRALSLPSLSELGMAGKLLKQLTSDICGAAPETLRNIHNLEGLIYIYSKKTEEVY